MKNLYNLNKHITYNSKDKNKEKTELRFLYTKGKMNASFKLSSKETVYLNRKALANTKFKFVRAKLVNFQTLLDKMQEFNQEIRTSLNLRVDLNTRNTNTE